MRPDHPPPLSMMSTPSTPTWRPTSDEVARLLRARTKDSTGSELGEWTTDTRPTLEEVEGLIDEAVGIVASSTGVEIAEPCANGAQRLAALLTAALIELSYFPEQVRADRSAYPEYKRLYDDGMVKLGDCIAAGGGDGSAEIGEGYTYYSLPVVPETTARARGQLSSSWTPWPAPFGDLPGDHWPEAENAENWRLVEQPPREPPLPEDVPVGDAPSRRAKEIE